MTTVGELSDWINAQFPQQLAEPWDAVGLVTGHREAKVTSVLICVDVTETVVRQAVETGVDFLLAHHPLLFGGVTTVAPDDHKGRIIHALIENRIALQVAHTNADSARPGVADALAAALGVMQTRPLEPASAQQLDKIVVYTPPADAEAVLDAMAAAGAGTIGNYERCGYSVDGIGTFRPTPGAVPHIGSVGQIEQVNETRLEMVAPRARRAAVVAALRQAHPYEEPAFDVVEMADVSGELGLGRVGRLGEPMALRDFAELVSRVLPATAQGVRVGGDLDRLVETVAVCGGSGDSLLPAANRSGADVYLTSDLKHHVVCEHLADGGCAVVDVAHFASEFPWCDQTAGMLAAWAGQGSDTVSVQVSRIVTDPWTHHLRSQS